MPTRPSYSRQSCASLSTYLTLEVVRASITPANGQKGLQGQNYLLTWKDMFRISYLSLLFLQMTLPACHILYIGNVSHSTCAWPSVSGSSHISLMLNLAVLWGAVL